VHADGFRLTGRRRYRSVDSERTNMFSGTRRYVSIRYRDPGYLLLDSTRGDEDMISAISGVA
jgi:hypothetical protein